MQVGQAPAVGRGLVGRGVLPVVADGETGAGEEEALVDPAVDGAPLGAAGATVPPPVTTGAGSAQAVSTRAAVAALSATGRSGRQEVRRTGVDTAPSLPRARVSRQIRSAGEPGVDRGEGRLQDVAGGAAPAQRRAGQAGERRVVEHDLRRT